MVFNKFILVSDTPKESGLAYYYNMAFKDLLNSNNVVLIDNIFLKFKSSKILYKLLNFLFYSLNIKSNKIYNQILDNIKHKDTYVIIFFNNGGLNFKYYNKLRKLENLYLVNYLSDHPFGLHRKQNQILKQTASIFDLFITFSSTINPILYRFGAKKVFNLPFAYCKYTHYLNEDIFENFDNDDIHYYGTWTREIEDMLVPLVHYNLKIHGASWKMAKNKHLRNIALNSSKSYSRNMVDSARKANIVINFTRAPHMCLHTMKTFELTIAGACVISNYSEEQNHFFPNYDSMIYFNTKEEMIEKINYFIFNKYENIKIRKNALLKAKDNNYHKRSKDLINYLNNI
jgi:hypothetical protein